MSYMADKDIPQGAAPANQLPPHIQHPGYPRAIGDIIERGSPEQQAALAAWLCSKFDFSVLREVPVDVPGRAKGQDPEIPADKR